MQSNYTAKLYNVLPRLPLQLVRHVLSLKYEASAIGWVDLHFFRILCICCLFEVPLGKLWESTIFFLVLQPCHLHAGSASSSSASGPFQDFYFISPINCSQSQKWRNRASNKNYWGKKNCFPSVPVSIRNSSVICDSVMVLKAACLRIFLVYQFP